MSAEQVRGRVYECDPSTETIVFNGRKYHRNPSAKQKHRQRYFWGRPEYGGGKKTAIHVAIWEHYNGPVPEGYLLHHKNGDRLNNDISNLECVTYSEHGKIHNTGRNLEGHRHKHLYTHVCIQCGATYQNFRKTKTKYCREACEKKYLRDNKLHHEVRVCVICQSEYLANKYRKSQTCSATCRARLCANNRKARSSGGLQSKRS